MAEQLRMEAVVADKATGPLRKIQQELAAFRETEGMKGLRENMKVLREQTSELTKATAGATAGMGGMGIGSLAASVSIGELVKTFKELADRAADLKALSKETGLTVDSINQLEHVAERFHVSPEKMASALGVLADKMVDFRRHTGDLFGELNQQRPEIAKRLLGENPEQQIQEVFKLLGTLAPGVRKRWAEAFFGDGDMARLVEDGYKGFAEAQEDAARSVPKITANYQEQAEAFHKSILEFDDALERLETKTGPFIFRELKTVAENLRSTFDDIESVLKWWQDNKDKSSKDFIDDNAKAFHDDMKRRADRNAAARAEGHGPLIDLPNVIAGSPERDKEEHQRFQRDRQNINPLFHKSSFDGFSDGGGSSGFGLQDIIQRGTRAGVVQGLLDFSDLKRAQSQAGGNGGGGGLQNASYETGGSGGFAKSPSDIGIGSAGGILDLIRKGETGSLGPDSYRSITNLWKGARPDITKMTIDQVLAFQKQMLASGVSDTAVGGFQINGTTLQDFKARMHLSGKEMFDPDLQTRMATAILGTTGGDIGRMRGRWSSLNKLSDSTIQGALGAGSGAASDAVDTAMKLKGAGINQAASALRSRMTNGEWCADSVNGVFKQAGVPGTGSSSSQSFRNWGDAVKNLADIRKGDVLVESHGGGRGHVGLATGQPVRDKHGNIVGVGMVSGNYGNRVNWNLERPGQIAAIRRARPNLWDAAHGAGMLGGGSTITHKGGADITIHGLPQGTSTHTKTQGLVQSVKLNRSSTMPELNWG